MNEACYSMAARLTDGSTDLSVSKATEKRKTLKEAVDEFTQETSINGVKHVNGPNHFKCRR